jgi:hypothetical protein
LRDPAPAAPARPEAVAVSDEALYPVRRYQPWRDLYPRSLEIDWAAFRSQPWFLDLGLSAGDPVGHHSLAMNVHRVPEAESTTVVGSYVNRRFWPTLGAVTSWDTAAQRGLVFDGVNQAYRQERTAASAFGALPVLRRSEHSVTLNLTYTAQWLTNTDEDLYEPDPNDAVPVFPITGRLARATAGLSYRAARGYAKSISAEEGRFLSAAVTLDDEALGGRGHVRTLTYTWEEFLRNPWLDGHVLSARLGGGISRGDEAWRRRFALGGFGEQDYLQSVIELRFVGGSRLRGYRPGAVSGDQFVLVNAEYRFPLAEVAAGLWTVLPVYLQNLHAAVFADWGNAFFGSVEPGEFKLGAGGELRNDFTIGYVQPVVLRLGYAHGFDEGGLDDVYVILGSGF